MTEEYSNIEQVELAIQAAERMVGQATMSMDQQQLENATRALAEARRQLEQAKLMNLNDHLLQYSSSRINRLSHQVEEERD
ncbi:DUF2564 family protein [Salipaludibacillus sp. CUR1]|uniref:DUF2564 family protein n=1 Tax=Salipaludibacillus sp. CUR1 TaxID=2820003 RepID=UPI001E2B23ED|nr:DUF2564 family protein [Salipaludibacillus sp. CUR1]MCE7792343.1 DUF2564 family protein [Salipaludibacillus sp. CUR1]